jgi:hypothetical protein
LRLVPGGPAAHYLDRQGANDLDQRDTKDGKKRFGRVLGGGGIEAPERHYLGRERAVRNAEDQERQQDYGPGDDLVKCPSHFELIIASVSGDNEKFKKLLFICFYSQAMLAHRAALKSASSKNGLKINVIFYCAPWFVRFLRLF